MSGLQIMVTVAGRQEIVNAENTGTAPVLISEIGLGTGKYEPSENQTALQAEFKRLSTIAGDLIADDTIHVSATDNSTDAYSYSEFGLYTDSGVLFAVYSQATDISSKTAQSIGLLSADVVFSRINATSLTFGDASFSNPPATETVRGVIELADNPEALLGEDEVRAMPPKRVHEAFKQYGLGTSGANGNTLNSPDFNLIRTTGFYYVSGTPTNGPAGVGGQGHLIVNRNFTGASVHVEQVFLQYNSNRKFFRRITGGSAQAWQEIAHTGNMPADFQRNGYMQLPNGFIIQWGEYAFSGSTTLDVTFPIAFPNTGLLAVAGDSGSSGNATQRVNHDFMTATGVRVIGETTSDVFSMIVIGY